MIRQSSLSELNWGLYVPISTTGSLNPGLQHSRLLPLLHSPPVHSRSLTATPAIGGESPRRGTYERTSESRTVSYNEDAIGTANKVTFSTTVGLIRIEKKMDLLK